MLIAFGHFADSTVHINSRLRIRVVCSHPISGRFPLHEDRKRIERQHSNEIEKLHTNDGDYHHGIHSGILAASRMFKKHADIVEHIEDEEDVPSADEIITIASEHKEKVEETKKNYPEVHVDAPPSAK